MVEVACYEVVTGSDATLPDDPDDPSDGVTERERQAIMVAGGSAVGIGLAALLAQGDEDDED